MESEFDANKVQPRTADQISKELEEIRKKQGEHGSQVHMGPAKESMNMAENRIEKDEVIIEDPSQPVTVPEDLSKITVRKTVTRNGKTVVIEITREKTRKEKEDSILQVLKDSGADSMQQIKGLARIQGIIWGS